MSRLLDQAIERQREAVAPITAPQAVTLADRASRRVAISMSYRMGRALLRFCDARSDLIGEHAQLVTNLREAMQREEFISAHIVALWGEVPETLHVVAERGSP